MEIQKYLSKGGATKIVVDYNLGEASAITFCLRINGSLVGFSLPSNHEGVLRAMRNDRKIPRSKCTDEQAKRVSWRILKDWVAAQMAIIESKMVEMQEVFLPYAITNSGTTLYKEISENKLNLLQLNP